MRIAERHIRVNPIADRLHALPASRGISEQMQSVGRQQVNFAEAARHQEANRLGRQFLDGNLTRSGAHGIGQPAILDDGGVGETQDTGAPTGGYRCYRRHRYTHQP